MELINSNSIVLSTFLHRAAPLDAAAILQFFLHRRMQLLMDGGNTLGMDNKQACFAAKSRGVWLWRRRIFAAKMITESYVE